ncbi:MAG: hypothetical protein JW780_06980, partial [Clostridiales bacterium]|nr:hypothetical protein [Clostridiales bacterium]
RRKAVNRPVSSVFFAPAEGLSEENYRRKAIKRPVSSVFFASVLFEREGVVVEKDRVTDGVEL